MNEFEYYFLQRKDDQAYPLIRITEREGGNPPTLIHIEFNDPIPRNPVMADYLAGSGIFITEKIVNEIKKINIEGVNFIATELTDNKGNMSDDYFCLHTSTRILAMDKEKSKYEYQFRIYNIEKFYLDKKVLKEIPLEQRLVFVLRESPEKVLFHKSVVDTIMAVNPTGMEFVNIEGYGGF